MLRPRIIPCLLIQNGGLIKTLNFGSPKYVGDPINAVRIFNEKEVDELIIIDIDASVKGLEPDYRLISQLAYESQMPLCYGGGINSISQIEKIISLGVEKVAVSSAAIKNPKFIFEAVTRVGSQSIVVVIDVKKSRLLQKYEVFINNGKIKTKFQMVEFAQIMAEQGVGEILINSIDCDGEMKGYDLNIVKLIKDKINLPLTVLGGAGSLSDFKELFKKFGILGAAAGSLFVFKGKYRAVLINYPNRSIKEGLISKLEISR